MSDTHPAIRAWQRLTGNLRRSPAVPIYAAGDDLTAALAECMREGANLVVLLAAEKTARREVEAALADYAVHDPACKAKYEGRQSGVPCTCGLHDALERR